MKLLYENLTERYTFTVFSNMTFPPHLQPDLELVFLKSGSMEVTVGKQTREIMPGQLAIAFPHQIHAYNTAVASHGIMLICPPSSFGEFQNILISQHPEEPFLPSGLVHKDVLYSLENLILMSGEQQEDLLVIRAYIHLLLARLLPCLTLQKNRDNQPMDQTMLLIGYLSEHFTEPVTLQTLAEELHISRYSVSRIFSEKLNTSFPRYLNTLRIDLAKKLLRTTGLDMLTISEQCGYETLRTFNREFQTNCGCSPREYQKHSGKTSFPGE